MKYSKRTSKEVPGKKRLRKIADQLWSRAVRLDWAERCTVCGRGRCHAHHVIPRQHESTRYLLRNGISLCAHCHQWNEDLAPHANAYGWMVWLEEHQPELHEWYVDTTRSNAHRAFEGKVTATYLCDVIRGLREYVPEDEYEAIVGAKFAKFLAGG